MSKENNITIGPITANLLNSLRSLHTARDYYYQAMDGYDLPMNVTPTDEDAFMVAGDLIEKKICDNIRTWAFSPGQTEI